ncbi:hypothetical protein FOL47_005742 [Perkinsus chesapeaki]|uniref:Uncharacterized protein n=1 Tax=Perkinsus chesapeaki TaxID=330153 RepID=A0A7J6LWU6_PERCH|nr:hypothetical protein FOL47_005742 [Perkinsus chesapeaki]
MIDDDSVIWKSPSSSSTPPHHHHHHEGVSVYSKHNSTTSTSTTFTTTSAGSSNKSYDKSSSSSWALKSPPVLSRLQLYREAWNDLIYYDNNNEDNILHDGSLSSSITTDDDDVNKSNDILLTVSEFNDGIGLRVIKDVPPHSSLGRINSKLIISIDHPIAQAYINEHKPDDDEEEEDGDNIMDSMIAAVICSIVYERKLDDKSIHRPLWRVVIKGTAPIGVGDLPDTSWVEQRGLFGNDNNNGDDDHLISYIANGTTMEGWYEKGNDICYKAYKWLLTTNNEDVRNILPIIENGEETSIENIVSHILESTSSSTSSSTTSSGTDDDDDTVNGGGSTIVDNTMLTINDVKWAYILLKGYGLWFDNEDGNMNNID